MLGASVSIVLDLSEVLSWVGADPYAQAGLIRDVGDADSQAEAGSVTTPQEVRGACLTRCAVGRRVGALRG
jgi:hypothetical protein